MARCLGLRTLIRSSWSPHRLAFGLAALALSVAAAPDVAAQHGQIPEVLRQFEGGVALAVPVDDVTVLKAPEPDLRRVYVYDTAAFDVVTKIYGLDGTTGRVLGQIDTGLLTNPVLGDGGKKIYLAETWFKRFSQGPRDDFIRCQDPTTFSTTCDFDIPEGRFLVMTMPQMTDITPDDRYLLFYQFAPEPGVGIVDLQAQRHVRTVPVPDCYLIFPSGPRSFFMLCREGTLLSVSFDERGEAQMRQTPVLRPADKHFFDTPAFSRKAGKVFFLSYDGFVYPVDLRGTEATFGTRFDLFDATERKEGWAPGGWLPAAWHRASNRLYVLVDKRAEWTHAYPSGHVYVYDTTTGRRVGAIKLEHPATSIAVSQDEEPLLYALQAHGGTLEIYDARTGALRHSVKELGREPYIVLAPE
jgi:methylamine dehydrogenase heavy chain